MFIVLEGLDGSGKTTQLNKIIEHVKDKYSNHKIIVTREPGGFECKVSEDIRNLLLSNDMDDYTRALLYAASRYEHQIKIREWIDEGYVVICDRYIYSSLAYQSSCMSEIDEIIQLNRFYDIIKPDHVIYLDITIDTYKNRKSARAEQRELDEIEKKNDEFFMKSLRFYEIGFMETKTRLTRVNANNELSVVTQDVLKNIDRIFEEE